MLADNEHGTCYWITGLSGAGKTTLGQMFYQHLRQQGQHNLVYLDGDTMREVFGNNHGHSPEERHQLAMSYARMCRMLTEQGIDVICATISMFDEVREWNRKNIHKYVEIYLDVPIKVLQQRDQKQLYSRALRGEVSNVMGVDVPVAFPHSPDIVLENDNSLTKPQLLEQLLQAITKLERDDEN